MNLLIFSTISLIVISSFDTAASSLSTSSLRRSFSCESLSCSLRSDRKLRLNTIDIGVNRTDPARISIGTHDRTSVRGAIAIVPVIIDRITPSETTTVSPALDNLLPIPWAYKINETMDEPTAIRLATRTAKIHCSQTNTYYLPSSHDPLYDPRRFRFRI